MSSTVEQKYTEKALTLMEESHNRYRDELRRLILSVQPIILAFIAALATVAAANWFQELNSFQREMLAASIVLLSASLVLAMIYLLVESGHFLQEMRAKSFMAIDQANSANKPNTWFLALAELSRRRAPKVEVRDERKYGEYVKAMSSALDAHKDDLSSWKMLKDPEKFYSNGWRDIQNGLWYSFWIPFFLGILFAVIFLLSILS